MYHDFWRRNEVPETNGSAILYFFNESKKYNMSAAQQKTLPGGCSSRIPTDSHNLNIQNYNFQELLDLFDLTSDMTLSDLKKAKRKVLFLHPDKSHLSAEYFLFYKRAFEIIVNFYEERTKQEREVPEEPIQYKPTVDRKENPNARKMTEIIRKYQTSSDETSEDTQHKFQQTFNDLFEKNMAKRPDPTRNQWFQDSAPVFTYDQATTQENLGQVMQSVKSQVAAIAKYRGVESVQYSGTSFHDDDDSATDIDYVSADMFSKLKYDDLRKVHKDQTVFAVSERDYDPSKRAHNLDRLSQERNTQDLTPLEKSRAESILIDQQREYEKRMFQRQHESRLRTIEYEQKNEKVIGAFMRLQNGSNN